METFIEYLYRNENILALEKEKNLIEEQAFLNEKDYNDIKNIREKIYKLSNEVWANKAQHKIYNRK